MGRRKKGKNIHGWIILDKPYDMTSTQAVAAVRRAFDAKKAGHAGTLDPLATGVLPIALGEATKTIPFIQDAQKGYSFTVRWGQQTSTDDREGEIIKTSEKRPSRDEITALLPQFIGEIDQIPPQFSAIKINGERAYDIARDGETVALKPRSVTIDTFTILDAPSPDETRFAITCGKGTYVRSLARDLGEKLGCYGHISALRRDFVGHFTADMSCSLTDVADSLRSPAAALDDIPGLTATADEARRLRQGNAISFVATPQIARLKQAGVDLEAADLPLLSIDDEHGQLLCLARFERGKLAPHRVFVFSAP